MAARPIVIWPDDRLRGTALEIERIDASVHDLYRDLIDTLRASRGLAAPQIGAPAGYSSSPRGCWAAGPPLYRCRS